MRDLERVLDVAFDKYENQNVSDNERLGWGRLIVHILGEMKRLVKDHLMERNREDIENVKAVMRLEGVKI